MGVAYNIRRGFGVGLPVPETSFEKLGPMHTHTRTHTGCGGRRDITINQWKWNCKCFHLFSCNGTKTEIQQLKQGLSLSLSGPNDNKG